MNTLQRIKIFLSAILVLAVQSLSAQTLMADKLIFQSEGADNAFWPTDNNGECSTKIIIECDLDGLDIQSDLINKQEYEDGHLVIYVFPPKKDTKKLTIRHDNYAMAEVKIWDEDKPLLRGCIYTIPIKALDNMLSVTITSIPEGGSILIDGKKYGETPEVIPLNPGMYKLEINKNGYAPFATALNVSKESNLSYVYDLSVPQKPKVKLIKPWDVIVLIDKKEITDSIISITSGKHLIEYANNSDMKKRDIEIFTDITLHFSASSKGELNLSIIDDIVNLGAISPTQIDAASDNNSSLDLEVNEVKSGKKPVIENEISNTPISNENHSDKRPNSLEDNIVYNTANVQQVPEFPGGDAAMYKWIREHIQYPASAAEEGIKGRVTVQLIVSKTGAIENVEIVLRRHPALDKEAIRLVKSMPRWNPARNNGEPVKCTYILPVTFNL